MQGPSLFFFTIAEKRRYFICCCFGGPVKHVFGSWLLEVSSKIKKNMIFTSVVALYWAIWTSGNDLVFINPYGYLFAGDVLNDVLA